MLPKDLKRFGLFISGLLTTFFEALSNLINQLVWRQILNPLCILFSFCIATFLIHKIKKASNNLQIKNNEDRIIELGFDSPESEKLRVVNFKLKAENSKVVLLF
jgi:hypothetical protein